MSSLPKKKPASPVSMPAKSWRLKNKGKMPSKYAPISYWLVVNLPLWKIWVRRLGWWHSQYMIWENKQCSKPPTRLPFFLSIPISKGKIDCMFFCEFTDPDVKIGELTELTNKIWVFSCWIPGGVFRIAMAQWPRPAGPSKKHASETGYLVSYNTDASENGGPNKNAKNKITQHRGLSFLPLQTKTSWDLWEVCCHISL